MDQTKRLNVGCGRNIIEGWVNLDFYQHPGVDVVCDLDTMGQVVQSPLQLQQVDRRGYIGFREPSTVTTIQRLPFADATFDEFLLSHVLEHIRNVYPLMSELWRIAKPDAIMTIRVPYGSSDDAWEDQTHVRAYFLQSFGYLGQPYHWKVPAGGYGYKADWKAEKITLLIPKPILAKANNDVDLLNRWVRHERNIVREMVCTLRKVDPPRPADRALVAVPPIAIEAVD